MSYRKIFSVLAAVCITPVSQGLTSNALPIVMITWKYQDPIRAGWVTITGSGSAVDAIEAIGHSCEMSQCRYTVGFGGCPDEKGETTLDAMIMDGTTHNVGAVGGLRRIKQAISVARKVMDTTDQTLLVGDAATKFAVEMGFVEENLTTSYSEQLWQTWKKNDCQPNFRKNVLPDPRKSCGPYHPINDTLTSTVYDERPNAIGENNHDTIGIIAIDAQGKVASGASTNGLSYKIPGYYAVSLMGTGLSPEDAAAAAIDVIRRKYPKFEGAVIAANKHGEYGAVCHALPNFGITVKTAALPDATIYNITCRQ